MRCSICFTVVSIACWLAVATKCSCARGQDDVAGSTIRLVSATEPVRDEPAIETTVQPAAEVVEASPSATPISPPDDQPPALPVSQQEEPAPATIAPATAHMPVEPAALNQHRAAARFYTGISGRTTSNEPPGPAPVQAGSRFQQNRRGGKPFQSVVGQPTISPYLYLTGNSTNAGQLPNYIAFVRPQLDQAEASRQQQREIQQLRTQLQKISSGGTGQQRSASMNTAARYMDTAQFYGGLQR